jgi:hypothetical protein
MSQIDFELGAIAHHCLQVYKKLGKNYYELSPDGDDAPDGRLLQLHRSALRHIQAQNGASLKQAYTLYKEFCDNTGIDVRCLSTSSAKS